MKVASGAFFSRSFWLLCLVGWLTVCGCYRPRYFQAGKPFVFKNNIELSGDLSKDEKKAIRRDLYQQIDDSLSPQVKDVLFLWHTILYPAVYDTFYAGSSLRNMHYYMLNKGFFSSQERFSYKIDTVNAKKNKPKKIQYRVTTTFQVKAGPRTLLDSIAENLGDSTLQRLTDSARRSSLLAKGDPFDGDKLNSEINRLIAIFKNHGYYAMTQDAFQAELDTVNTLLINPAIDPLERIHQYALEQQHQKNPTTDLYITLRQDRLDSALLKRYYLRWVYIYPDFENTRDNRKTPLTGLVIDSVILRYHSLKFKPSFLMRNNYLKPGDLYSQENYNKSINNLNYLGVWQVPIIQVREVRDTVPAAHPKVDSAALTRGKEVRTGPIDTALINEIRRNRRAAIDSLRKVGDTAALADSIRREENENLLSGGFLKSDTSYRNMDLSYHGYVQNAMDSVGQLDVYYLLTPAKRRSLNADVELNYSNENNNAQSQIAGGNIFGFAGDLGVTNRNVGKEAITMTNTVSAGVQLNPTLNWDLASIDLGYTNTFYIPRFVTPFASINRKNPLAKQTVITTNATYVERIGYFDLNTFNFKYGYQWKRDTNMAWIYNPVDIEYSYLYNVTQSFEDALAQNPFLRFAYTTALIMAQSADWLYSRHERRHPNRLNLVHANLETSGLLTGVIKRATNDQAFSKLFQYVRPSIDYKHEISYPNNNSWDFRLFAGVGIPLGGDSSLPFFKQFVAGGPNSMRAWPFRSLGPGSVHLAPYATDVFNDRFGDIQFEGNIEYRYNIATIIPNSMYLKGALFTDIGNVWYFKKQPFAPGSMPAYDSATLDISHLYQQLAVGAGAGFRVDFNYFVLRFDFGFRFKRPDIPLNDGWQFPDITIAHVFGRSDQNKIWRYNNYNFSFGIGYSF